MGSSWVPKEEIIARNEQRQRMRAEYSGTLSPAAYSELDYITKLERQAVEAHEVNAQLASLRAMVARVRWARTAADEARLRRRNRIALVLALVIGGGALVGVVLLAVAIYTLVVAHWVAITIALALIVLSVGCLIAAPHCTVTHIRN